MFPNKPSYREREIYKQTKATEVYSSVLELNNKFEMIEHARNKEHREPRRGYYRTS